MTNNKTFLDNSLKPDISVRKGRIIISVVKKVFGKTTVLIILFGQISFMTMKLNVQDKLIQKQQEEIERLRKASKAEKGSTIIREIGFFIIQWYFTQNRLDGIKENLAETNENVQETQKTIEGTAEEFNRKFTLQDQLNEEYNRGINKNTELLWNQTKLVQNHHREIANLEKTKAKLKSQIRNQDKKLTNTKKRTKLVEAFTHSLSESHKNMKEDLLDEMNQLKNDLKNKRAEMLNSKREIQRLYKRLEKIKSNNSSLQKKREELDNKILISQQKDDRKSSKSNNVSKIQDWEQKLEEIQEDNHQKIGDREKGFRKTFSNFLSKVNLSLALEDGKNGKNRNNHTETNKKKEKNYICEVSPYLPPVLIQEDIKIKFEKLSKPNKIK